MVDEQHQAESPNRVTKRPRTRGSRIRGCGCLFIVIGIIASPFIAASLTHGLIHQVLLVIAGIDALLLLIAPFVIIASTREGRGDLRDSAFEAFLEVILGRFLG